MVDLAGDLRGRATSVYLRRPRGSRFTNASLSGTYACKLDGSFLLQPFSVNTLTFTADGKGSIEGLGNVSTALAVKSGNMSALMSKFGTSQVPSSACLLF